MSTASQKGVRLGVGAVRDLENALGDSLPERLREDIERHLNSYRDVPRATGDHVKGWRSDDAKRIAAARELLRLLPTSSQDVSEAIDRSTGRSTLEDLLIQRLAQWEAEPIQPRKAVRPEDWNRRVLLWRCMDALDAAGVPKACHEEGPRVTVLREVLRLADRLDRRPVTKGSLRLIQSVYRDRRNRDTWGPRHILRYRYERAIAWPRE